MKRSEFQQVVVATMSYVRSNFNAGVHPNKEIWESMVRIGLVKMLRYMQMKMRMEQEKQYNIISTTKVSLIDSLMDIFINGRVL